MLTKNHDHDAHTDYEIATGERFLQNEADKEQAKATIDDFWQSLHDNHPNKGNLKMSLDFVERFRPLDKTYAWVRVNRYGSKDCGNIEEIDFHRFMELAQKGYSPVNYEFHRVLLQNFNNVALIPHMGVICDGMWLLEGPKEEEPQKKKDNFIKVFIDRVLRGYSEIGRKIVATYRIWRNADEY